MRRARQLADALADRLRGGTPVVGDAAQLDAAVVVHHGVGGVVVAVAAACRRCPGWRARRRRARCAATGRWVWPNTTARRVDAHSAAPRRGWCHRGRSSSCRSAARRGSRACPQSSWSRPDPRASRSSPGRARRGTGPRSLGFRAARRSRPPASARCCRGSSRRRARAGARASRAARRRPPRSRRRAGSARPGSRRARPRARAGCRGCRRAARARAAGYPSAPRPHVWGSAEAEPLKRWRKSPHSQSIPRGEPVTHVTRRRPPTATRAPGPTKSPTETT